MDVALRLIRERWGRRMIERGLTSICEEWHPSGSWRGPGNAFVGMYRSLSHAWSACPAEFLVRELVGFEILEPGCARVRLDPAPVDFDYRADIPTPRGTVTVESAAGRLRVGLPDGVERD